jgi:protein-L-isoaspartate(D-aspartate) O-methyltransferase
MATDKTLRRRLVASLRKKSGLRDDAVAEAFATVPRHVFVPGHALDTVYGDNAIVTKVTNGVGVSSSSQPSIMAIMLQQLEMESGMRVLEVGAGTGYNAALLSHLAGKGGRVTTVDIDKETARDARHHLRAAGYDRVRVHAGDGGFGYDAGAPYDRIIATASCWQIPQPWIDQLSEGGLLVLPFRLNGVHVCLALRKEGAGLTGTDAAMCGFMPLRGAFSPTVTQVAVNGLRASADARLSMSLERALPGLLERHAMARVPYPRQRNALNTPLYYIALQGKPVLLVLRPGQPWDGAPFALLATRRSAIGLPWQRPPRAGLPLHGEDEAQCLLMQILSDWEASGRPDLRQLRVSVRPTSARLGPLPQRRSEHYRFRRGVHMYRLHFER